MEVFLQNIEKYPYTKGILIIGTSILAAFAVDLLYKQILKLFEKNRSRLDDKILEALRKPIFWTVFFSGMYFEIFVTKTFATHIDIVQKIVVSSALLIWGIASIKIIEAVVHEIAHRTDNSNSHMLRDMIPFLNTAIKLAVATILLLTILSTWNIDIRPALASAGVAGVAIAFAAKDTIANLFGGISVFFDKPYKTGDVVIIQEKYRGEVLEIGMRSTKIRTLDNVMLSIPNSLMVTTAVINETGFDPKLRISVPVGVSYNTDLDKAESIIMDVLGNNEDILDQPEPAVRFKEFGDSAILLEAQGYVSEPGMRVKVVHSLIKEFKNALDKNNIDIPFPQRDLHIVGRVEEKESGFTIAS